MLAQDFLLGGPPIQGLAPLGEDGGDDSDDSRDESSVSRPRRRGKSVFEDRVANAKARVEISSPEAHAGATFLQNRAVAALDDEGSTDDEGDV
jgi:hypothetical protein